ncbi:E3 ubiquitin-protein ligase RNF168 isoform X2 [Ranitomeya variabilis]|uniref:E3 ubiquitin-protein ligase RNF168 isoform X2 n=1 Tax=Ranitomeya variabilis TaxID=490064 RepID=UPI0040564E75
MPKKEKNCLPRSECICGICREILLEPVTLPCSHTLCYPCFTSTVEKASLCCPYCRQRVSNWARKNARSKTLVNNELWEIIQSQYPEECERRASGQDTSENDFEDGLASYPAHLICNPGEIRKEYEAEISKIETERLNREEEERKASEEYIQKLLAEEEEAQRLHMEHVQGELNEQLKRDEELAWMINSDLNESTTSNQSSVIEMPVVSKQTTGVKPSKNIKTKPKQSGDIERFLSPKANRSIHITSSAQIRNEQLKSINSGLGTQSYACVLDSDEDSMPSLSPQFSFSLNDKEVAAFDTELQIPCLSACSPINAPQRVMSASGSSYAEAKDRNKTPSNMAAEDFSLPLSSIGQGDCGQRRYSESSIVASAPDVKTAANRALESPIDADSHSAEKLQIFFCPDYNLAEGLHTERLMELEKILTERKIQEEQDRLLALKLQKLLDKEDNKTNRSKGSPDEYKLRPKRTTAQEKLDITPLKMSSSENPGNGDTSDENKQPAPKKQKQQTRYKGRHSSSKTQSSEVLRPSNKQQTLLDMFQRSATK